MSTRSFIGMLGDDGLFTGIYCHFDGYIEGVGKILNDHYQDKEKVTDLINLGNISSLGERVAPGPHESHSFGDPCDGVTVAYTRDRGEEEEDNVPRKFSTLNEVVKQSTYEYVYIYESGERGWWVGQVVCTDNNDVVSSYRPLNQFFEGEK